MIPGLLDETGIPGLQVAVVEEGALAWHAEYGVASTATGQPVTTETVFEAASLSKPVLAYLALRMVARGELDLDRPLHEILAYERFAGDRRAEALTARLVLSHQTGLPNWGGNPLTFDADPGSRFGYSGEGYVYLQRAIEAQTGSTLEALARRQVFEPLGMSDSRFTWTEETPPPVLASGHDAAGEALERRRPEANAASSLHTTARDYARFLVAVLSSEGLDTDLVHAALEPAVTMRGDERGDDTTAETGATVAWGLGWGLQDFQGERVAWHWGDNGIFRAFVAFRPQDRSGIVYFANSANGLAIAQQLIEPVVGDMSPTIRWLAYGQSTEAAWKPRRQGLLAESADDYDAAIEHYAHALTLDADDRNLARRIEWLRDLQRVRATPVALPRDRLERFAGRYGPRTLRLDGSGLSYQREGRDPFALVALGDDTFALDGVVDFRLQVVTDEGGNPTKLIGHYLAGNTDESPRDAG